jgi:hypothetical protein
VNVYNPRAGGPRIQEWPRISAAPEEAQGEVLLLGDFNSHHPTWGGRGIACEQGAEHLLHEIKRWELAILTPEGETTWRRGPQNSVIDLTFASQAISERIIFCGPEERWALLQDHIPIRISFDIQQARDAHAGRRRYALQKLDIEGLTRALRGTGWQQTAYPLELASARDSHDYQQPRSWFGVALTVYSPCQCND